MTYDAENAMEPNDVVLHDIPECYTTFAQEIYIYPSIQRLKGGFYGALGLEINLGFLCSFRDDAAHWNRRSSIPILIPIQSQF